MLLMFALAAAVVTPAGSAAPHPLVGTWKISYPWHLDVENGVLKATMESGRLTVEVQGDSLIATVFTDPSPMFPNRRPIRLAAVPSSSEVVFVNRDQVTVSGATPRVMTAVNTWIFKPNGDQLEGSLERRLEGVGRGHGPQPLRGARVGS